MTAQEQRVKDIIKAGGFYGKSGLWNSIIKFNGDPKLYRERVETIVVRNNKEVFCKRKPDGEYFLPGGSTEKGRTHKEQAIAECREEIHANITDVEFSGITYKETQEIKDWMRDECEVLWDGRYTEIYTATYSSKFKGHVAKEDEDSFIRSGRWYPIKECMKFFRKEHKEALLQYTRNHSNKETDDEEITESYAFNYFKNKRLLRKISKTQDIDRGAVDQMISTLKKSYSKLNTSSNIQREKRSSDVSNLFHPVLGFTFPDGHEINIALCFDEKEFSPGAALHSDTYGDVIIIYPVFFKATKDNQIFTLLHEIGHIRLNHIDERNLKHNLFGDDITNEHRIRLMDKGKVMYTELNADLYAVLNGASMYSILTGVINKDYDKKYDYRLTNEEIANRYKYVYDKFKKLRGNTIYESSSFSDYDIACMAITEMVYDNPHTEELSESEKDDLFSILYEYEINQYIKEDEEIQESEENFKRVLTSCQEYNDYFLENGIDVNEILDKKENSITNSKEKGILPIVLKNREDLDNSFNKLELLRSLKYKSPVTFSKPPTIGKCNPKVTIVVLHKKDVKDHVHKILLDIIQQLNMKSDDNPKVYYFKKIINRIL